MKTSALNHAECLDGVVNSGIGFHEVATWYHMAPRGIRILKEADDIDSACSYVLASRLLESTKNADHV